MHTSNLHAAADYFKGCHGGEKLYVTPEMKVV